MVSGVWLVWGLSLLSPSQSSPAGSVYVPFGWLGPFLEGSLGQRAVIPVAWSRREQELSRIGLQLEEKGSLVTNRVLGQSREGSHLGAAGRVLGKPILKV